jgi:hypothetical protein
VIISRKINDKDEIEKIVKNTFMDDNALFETYHVINNDVEGAIRNTISKILESIRHTNKYVFYVLIDSETNEQIGYFSGIRYGSIINDSSASMLHSFGLHITKRNKQNVKRLFELAKTELGGASIICGLYHKNTRAIKSLMMEGYEELSSGLDNNEPYVILKLKDNANNDSRLGCRCGNDCGKCQSAI